MRPPFQSHNFSIAFLKKRTHSVNNRKIDGVQLVCRGVHLLRWWRLNQNPITSCSGNTTTNERETLSNSPRRQKVITIKPFLTEQSNKGESLSPSRPSASPTIGSSKQTKNRLLYSRWLPQAPPKNFFLPPTLHGLSDGMAHVLGKEPRRDRSAKRASTKWVAGRCKKVAQT